MEQKSLKKNAFYSVLKVFLTLLFPLITFPYASRILLPEGIGKVNFANSIISYFIMLASLGIGGYATREAAKIRDDKKALTKLFKEIITINLICCIIAYILFFLSLFFVPKFHEYRDLLLVCSIKIIFSVLGIEWLFTANEEFKYITIRSFIIQLFSLLYLFIFVKTRNDIIHYAIFGILTAVGCNLFNFFLLGKYLDFSYKPVLEIKKHLKAIVIFFGMSVVTRVFTMLDTTMLGFLSNDTQVGYYTASTKLIHMVVSMLAALTAVLLPRLTNYAHNNDSDSFKDLVNKSSNIIILLAIPMASGLFILAKPLLLLLGGEKYLPSIISMRILSPILLSISLGSLIGGQILPAIGLEKKVFYSYIVGAITNITFNSILIPKYGTIGAATASILAESVVTCIQLFFVRKLVINKTFIITILQSLLASSIMICLIYILNKFISNILLQTIISFLVGCLTYSLILIIVRNKYFLFYLQKIFMIFNRNKEK